MSNLCLNYVRGLVVPIFYVEVCLGLVVSHLCVKCCRGPVVPNVYVNLCMGSGCAQFISEMLSASRCASVLF